MIANVTQPMLPGVDPSTTPVIARLQPYRVRLDKLAGEARRRKGGRLWFEQQAEALLVPAAVAPWEWDEALAWLERAYNGGHHD